MSKTNRPGFTLIELLVVISIIVLLVAIMVPALGLARQKAKEASAKGTITSLSTGLEQFKTEYGSYPSSARRDALDNGSDYSIPITDAVDNGAQRLVEAMVGIDLLGYANNGDYYVPATGVDMGIPSKTRDDAYVDVGKMQVENFRQMDETEAAGRWDALNVPAGNDNIRKNLNPIFSVTIHPKRTRPILYFKAIKNQNSIEGIFPFDDNLDFLKVDGDPAGDDVYATFGTATFYGTGAEEHTTYRGALWDGITGRYAGDMLARPFNKDSFILITAGNDGEFGTEDDIGNFNPKK